MPRYGLFRIGVILFCVLLLAVCSILMFNSISAEDTESAELHHGDFPEGLESVLGGYGVYFYHDSERGVGIWIYHDWRRGGIAVLPDSEYIQDGTNLGGEIMDKEAEEYQYELQRAWEDEQAYLDSESAKAIADAANAEAQEQEEVNDG